MWFRKDYLLIGISNSDLVAHCELDKNININIPKMGFADICGIIALVITVSMTLISFVTPYWMINDHPPDYVIGPFHQGLLAQCTAHKCDWLFDNDMFMERHMPDWFKATQGLMSVGLGLGLIGLLVATLSLCCTCHSCNPNQPICGLLLVACLCMGVGIVIFGIKAKDEWHIAMQWELTSLGRFGWSFWVGIGAAALALLTSVIYGCMGRKHN